jgi:putative chitinase
MDINKLLGHVPQKVLDELPGVISQFHISTPLRLAHFLSQCAHESGEFKAVSENLNYSAKGLMTTFSRYFPNEAIAKQYERQPEKIANKVYADRMGNGNEASGDGWKYRGRGYLQTTGKSNYSLFDATVPDNLVITPDLVATKYPLTSAGFFFTRNKIWEICDGGESEEIIKAVTKKVNGGYNGLDDRIKKFKLYQSLL